MRHELVQPLLIVYVPLGHGDGGEGPCFLVVISALIQKYSKVGVSALICVP